MIRSMTGFGSAELETPELRAAVAVRSLNHRFLDLSVATPRRLAALEPRLKALVQERVRRGKLELSLRASLAPAEGGEVLVASGLASGLVGALRRLEREHGLEGGLRAADLARFPGVVELAEPQGGPDESLQQRLLDLAGRALQALEGMRRAEGAALAAELGRLLDAIAAAALRLERLAEEGRAARRAALVERLRALAAELGLDDARLYQEAVRQAERADVAEELQRLRSHVDQARELVAGADGEPAGKRLDFLAQELMREANTLGAKAGAAAMVREVVELKALIERVREQVQNVE